MRIGMRTIKTALAATVAMAIAAALGLHYWTLAGILSMMTIATTTRATVRFAIVQSAATVFGLGLAWGLFTLIPYPAVAFGLWLLVYIALTNLVGLQDTMIGSAVLVLPLLVVQPITIAILLNQLAVLLIAALTGLVLNLFMPNLSDQISFHVASVEKELIEVLGQQANLLMAGEEGDAAKHTVWEHLSNLKQAINEGTSWTARHQDNQLFDDNEYYEAYFEMRNNQYELLRQMQLLLDERVAQMPQRQQIGRLIAALIKQDRKKNNPVPASLTAMERLQEDLSAMSLPDTREQFFQQASATAYLVFLRQMVRLKDAFDKIVASQNR
ncbi:aromatic acid exporter family protein [Schleiferilactobacillus perolens]|uniref:aromatic acid exporter family protein n=1 Tax=Schleiferilactobacillus perolens TaxID=100468 RepID=UPI000A4007D2